MGYLFIIFLFGIGFIAFFIWFFKETWNDRGIRGELEKANMLKRLELELKYNDNQLFEEIDRKANTEENNAFISY